MGKSLSDPRHPFNAAVALSYVDNKLEAAAEALHLSARIDGHVGSHLAYHAAWMRFAVGAQDHMRAVAKAADRLPSAAAKAA